jgi:phosphoglycerate dehydrogenase-like enzyme
MNTMDKVAVCSRSFSKNKILRESILRKYEHVKFNDDGIQLIDDVLIDYLKGYTKIIIGLEKITSNVIAKLPDLKVVSKYGVGTDMIDMNAMKERNIALGWKAGINKRAVSELALCFSIAMLRYVPQALIETKNGTFNQFKGNLLSEKTFGIIGYGNIGKDLITLLEPFNCKILIFDILEVDISSTNPNIKQVSLERLLSDSDLVSLHLPLTDQSKNIINAEKLSYMQEHSILINLSRGGLVDEIALKEALQSKSIFGAAFDVFSEEPPADKELLMCSNLLATPHIGGLAKESIMAMGFAAIEGLDENSIPN